jgi:hypothetical protein
MDRKKDWLVALALSVTMVGVAHASGGALLEIDGIKGEAEKRRPKSEKGAEKPKDIAPRPNKPQGLLLPAVQKSGSAPHNAPPAPTSQQESSDVETKPKKQRGLLLPAVQKASDSTPDAPPPSPRSKPRVAAGDVNGDGRADVVGGAGSKPQSNRGRAVLTTRKAGEGQRRGKSGQIRTNE